MFVLLAHYCGMQLVAGRLVLVNCLHFCSKFVYELSVGYYGIHSFVIRNSCF